MVEKRIFSQKDLVISEKSSNFAPDFAEKAEKKGNVFTPLLLTPSLLIE